MLPIPPPAVEPPDPPLLRALARRGAESPDDPFLIFRGARGHFRWWSFAEALRRATARAFDDEKPGETEAAEFLRHAAAASALVEPAAAALADALPASPARDSWISHRALGDPLEAALALWAATAGAAVLREPAPAIHPALFAWARPTILSESAAAISTLLTGFAAEAPRWGATRWRRRRLDRLRAVVVGDGDDGARNALAAQLAALGARSPRVLPFPHAGW